VLLKIWLILHQKELADNKYYLFGKDRERSKKLAEKYESPVPWRQYQSFRAFSRRRWRPPGFPAVNENRD